jgi:hypothetical protein
MPHSSFHWASHARSLRRRNRRAPQLPDQIDRRHWRTREEARMEVFWWLEAVYTGRGGILRRDT